ncbi:hypothetical protein EVAR_65735_1 [Eumeta japonica]|uniref:Uncharacterized protein n=1 Tax=Eumeta variegata TaxID=151549 RepID=A0A4C1ZSE7_EUMVA|nr:hypothetical protein EVAR_65735_1 [Eumeta japonica]
MSPKGRIRPDPRSGAHIGIRCRYATFTRRGKKSSDIVRAAGWAGPRLLSEISSKNVSATGTLNEFFYQQCTWALDSNVERQLFIEITSEQDKSCGSWNITVHEWSSPGGTGPAVVAGELLYTFCARNKHHTYTLPWRLNTVVIRYRGVRARLAECLFLRRGPSSKQEVSVVTTTHQRND